MLDYTRYLSSLSVWNGLYRYVQDHPNIYAGLLPDLFTEDDLLKVIKKQAQSVLSEKEYDTFRKAFTALRKSKAISVKKENLYRLFFVLGLGSDTEAQDLLLNYLHHSELSARTLDDFIIIAALKIHLSWEETCSIRNKYAELIALQPMSPSEIAEGQTAEVYYSVIYDRLHTADDLCEYLDDPDNTAFFARTCNTQYLALFDDVKLEVLYNGNQEEVIRLYTNYGLAELETIQDYYFSLFGLPGTVLGAEGEEGEEEESLSEAEIMALADLFEDVFMSYDTFCLLVQRKRPVNISSGTFLLALLKKLLTEEDEVCEDFYVDFLDPEEFREVINDILIYFGYPILDPDLDSFERLLLDTYNQCLTIYPETSNADFQQTLINNLRTNLKYLASANIE